MAQLFTLSVEFLLGLGDIDPKKKVFNYPQSKIALQCVLNKSTVRHGPIKYYVNSDYILRKSHVWFLDSIFINTGGNIDCIIINQRSAYYTIPMFCIASIRIMEVPLLLLQERYKKLLSHLENT